MNIFVNFKKGNYEKIILMLLIFCYSFENSMDKAVKSFIIKENDLYRILCINNYEFIMFKFGKTDFQQFLERENSKNVIAVVQVKCKSPDNN